MNTELPHLQTDMRRGYHSGGPGVLASSIAWFVAGMVVLQQSPVRAMWALFIGGMLIHPVGLVICKAFGSRGNHTKGNALGLLAGASTFWLIFMLPLAYVIALHRIEWFFPAMLLVIGGRYLVFASLFGMRTYWVLGLGLAGAGFLLARLGAAPAVSAFTGAGIEAAFAIGILVLHGRWTRAAESSVAAPARA